MFASATHQDNARSSRIAVGSTVGSLLLADEAATPKPNAGRSDNEKFIYDLALELGGDAPTIVSELYSPPRVTAAARELRSLGLTPGFALDLLTTDGHGVAWDFSKAERRAEARRRVQEQTPTFVVGPPCARAFARGRHSTT